MNFESIRRNSQPIPGYNTVSSGLLKSQLGVAMLEFAIVFGIILLLVVAIIDLSRFSLANNLASHAAKGILDRAKTSPALHRDVRFAENSTDAERFNAMRRQIIDSSLGSVGFAGPGAREHGLLGRTVRFELPNPFDPTTPTTHDALLLMPGERAQRLENGQRTEVLHPTCVECKAHQNPSLAGFELLNARNGMYAQVALELPLYIMGGRRVLVTGEAVSWKEIRPKDQRPELLGSDAPTESCVGLSQAEACSNAGCDEAVEYCEFHPENYTPDCVTCMPKTCGTYWVQHEQTQGTSFCDAIACGDPALCRFSPDLLLADVGDPLNCGQCAEGRRCTDFISNEDSCELRACDVGTICTFLPFKITSDPTECTECRSQRCDGWTDEATACSRLECGTGKTCFFMPWHIGDRCAECRPAACEFPAGGCEAGRVWTGPPRCTCCRYQDCSERNNPRTGARFGFDARECRCIKLPDDSTGDV